MDTEASAAGRNPIAAASDQPSAFSHQLVVLGASRLGPILSKIWRRSEEDANAPGELVLLFPVACDVPEIADAELDVVHRQIELGADKRLIGLEPDRITPGSQDRSLSAPCDRQERDSNAEKPFLEKAGGIACVQPNASSPWLNLKQKSGGLGQIVVGDPANDEAYRAGRALDRAVSSPEGDADGSLIASDETLAQGLAGSMAPQHLKHFIVVPDPKRCPWPFLHAR